MDRNAYDVTSPDIHPVVVKTTKTKKYNNQRKERGILETRMVIEAYQADDKQMVKVKKRL